MPHLLFYHTLFRQFSRFFYYNRKSRPWQGGFCKFYDFFARRLRMTVTNLFPQAFFNTIKNHVLCMDSLFLGSSWNAFQGIVYP